MSKKIQPMTPGIPQAARVRAYLAGIVVSLGITGVAWRAYGLQVDEGEHYRELAERQHAMIVDIPAPRGEIRDAKGRPLAVSADVDSIWANPREIKDVTETAAKLAPLLNVDPSQLEAKLGADKKFVWLARHVAKEVATKVAAAKLPGIVLAKEPRRWYPAQKVGGTVVGRSDIDNRGLDGVELAMDTQLTGKHTANPALRDARGHRMYADGLATAQPGATVQLSIDRTIQALAETALADGVTANKAKSGVCIVLDVATSKVVAMASYPTYDPNTGEGLAQGARNKPVTDAFEAGSVMKVFSVAAALDAGVVTPDTMFDTAGGALTIAKHTIKDVHPDGNLSVAGIIKRSSNVGAAKIAMRFGATNLYDALKRYGFGARTGIEMPGEQHGMLRDGAKWREVELATISFGYGLTTTPLQIASALAAIGNDGVYTTPHVVDKVMDPDGNTLWTPKSESHPMMKPATAAAMRSMLAGVFDKDDKAGHGGGTAKDLTVPGFKCGGKTGTANKYDPATKGYSADHYLASFAGLAPIDHPRLAIVVMIDDPTGGVHYGGSVSGPVFATVASQALRYLGVPGEALPPPPPAPVVAVKKKPVVAPVVAEEAVAAEALSDLPDFRGLGVARSLELAREHHLELELTGSGRVIDQEARGPGRILLHLSDGNSPNLHKPK